MIHLEAVIPKPKNENERIIARIDAVRDRVTDELEDGAKLDYIRSQITPTGLKLRADDTDVSHLHEVAKSVLKSYEKKEVIATDD